MPQQLPIESVVHRTGNRPFSLHHTIVPKGEPGALYLHCHPEAELFYLEQGDITFTIEGKETVLTSGDAIFIPPNLIHNAVNNHPELNGCNFHATVFSTDLLMRDFFPNGQIYFDALSTARMDCIFPLYASNPDHALLLQNLSAIAGYREESLETYELALTGRLLFIWQSLYNLRFRDLTRSAKHHNQAPWLQSNLDYIKDTYADSITLDDLAAQAGFSSGYYCHRFKAATGLSPIEYLIKIRIVKSCDYLVKTDKKITEIASLCGFNTISYFNRTFLQLMGTTPGAYRREELSKSHSQNCTGSETVLQ